MARFGLSQTPKKRLTEFYMKHKPEKVRGAEKKSTRPLPRTEAGS